MREISKEILTRPTSGMAEVVRIEVRPEPPGRSLFRVVPADDRFILAGGILLMSGVHETTIGLVVPPDIAKVGIEYVRPRVDMTDNAGTGRHCLLKLMANGVAGFARQESGVLKLRVRIGLDHPTWIDVTIRAETLSPIAVSGPFVTMDGTAIIPIHDMAGTATAGAVIAGMIVRTEQAQGRVEQTGFLKSDENRIGAQVGAKSAYGEFDIRSTGIFLSIGQAGNRSATATAFKDAKDVAGLRDFPSRER